MAQAGDANAQYELALAYYDGIGIIQSKTEAFSWFLASVNNGFSDAIRRLIKKKDQMLHPNSRDFRLFLIV